MRKATDVRQKGVAHNLSSNSFLKVFCWLEVSKSLQVSQVLNSLTLDFRDLAICTAEQPFWNGKWPFPKLFTEVRGLGA